MPRKNPEPLMSAPLAYENKDFLDSPDARVFRMMAEYQEPMTRFRRERIQDTVVFFGSARFRALDVASHELELLENTGSAKPAPADEQPARADEVDQRRSVGAEDSAGRGGGRDGALLRGRTDAGRTGLEVGDDVCRGAGIAMSLRRAAGRESWRRPIAAPTRPARRRSG